MSIKMEETKTKSGFGGTKRRKFSYAPYTMSAINNRVTKLYKQLKMVNPNHLYDSSVSGFPGFTTTGGIYDLCQGIAQGISLHMTALGDAYNQRFGNKIVPRSCVLRAGIVAGSTSTAQSICRITLIRAPANLSATGTVGVTLSPIANTNVLQIYYDREFMVPAVNTSASGYPVHISFAKKIRLSHIKFSGAGTGVVSAESLFLIWSSNVGAGTAAPGWGAGNVEFYYSP